MTRKKKKASLGSRILVAVLCVAMMAGIGFFAWRIFHEVNTTFTLIADINEARKELDELKKEQEMLVQQKEQLMDENYVKTWARGEYLITKEGEEIYKLPSQND